MLRKIKCCRRWNYKVTGNVKQQRKYVEKFSIFTKQPNKLVIHNAADNHTLLGIMSRHHIYLVSISLVGYTCLLFSILCEIRMGNVKLTYD